MNRRENHEKKRKPKKKKASRECFQEGLLFSYTRYICFETWEDVSNDPIRDPSKLVNIYIFSIYKKY